MAGGAAFARPLVYAPLFDALGEVDAAGTLRGVMERLEARSSLRGDPDWRCVRDRFAHLRLARLCAEAATRGSA